MSWTIARDRHAGLHTRAVDDPERLDARRELTYDRLADRIREDIAAAPALTPGQRDRLALLLRADDNGPRRRANLAGVEPALGAMPGARA